MRMYSPTPQGLRRDPHPTLRKTPASCSGGTQAQGGALSSSGSSVSPAQPYTCPPRGSSRVCVLAGAQAPCPVLGFHGCILDSQSLTWGWAFQQWSGWAGTELGGTRAGFCPRAGPRGLCMREGLTHRHPKGQQGAAGSALSPHPHAMQGTPEQGVSGQGPRGQVQASGRGQL